MIALISFDNAMSIERKIAEKLNLNYIEKERFGCRTNSYSDDSLEPLTDYDYYIDDLIKTEVDDKTFYFKEEGDDKPIDSYHLYTKPKKDLDYVYIEKENNLVDLEDFALKCMYGYRITKCIKSEEPSVNNIKALLNKVEEKTNNINKTLDILHNQSFNDKTNVHVGGGLMVTYNDLMLKENCCTDVLQSTINNGWRIIAVCVQSDQRRPDYILGRYNLDKDITVRDEQFAKREEKLNNR